MSVYRSSLLLFVVVLVCALFARAHTQEVQALAYSSETPQFSHTSGDICMYVERVTVHRYFNIYSYVYGDRSQMEIELMLVHLKQEVLQKGDVHVTATDDAGNKMFPVPLLELCDFPPDHPLGHKLSLVIRFPLPEPEVKTISITLNYMGRSFVIKALPIQ